MPGPIESIQEAERRKDPTQSYMSTMHHVTNHVDGHALEQIAHQSQQRRVLNAEITKLSQHINQLNEDLPKLEDGSMTAQAFFDKYRESIAELTEVWNSHREEFQYLLPEGEEFFITNETNHAAVTPQAVEKVRDNCIGLRRSLEQVKLEQLNITLTAALQLNVILLQALAKLTEKVSEESRMAVRNQNVK